MPTLGPAPRNLRGVARGVDFVPAAQADAGDVRVGSVDLYWNVPPGTEPEADSTYTVQYARTSRGFSDANEIMQEHSMAFGLAGARQATHPDVNSVPNLESQKHLYYRVRVGNSRWSTPVRVNLVANDKRPDSLTLGPSQSMRVAGGTGDTLLSLVARDNKYLTRIDLSWDFESDDYPLNADGTPPTTKTPRPTGYLIDYYIGAVDAEHIYWQPLQSNTGYSRGTYNHIRGLKPGQTVHYRVFSWHTNNYGVPAATTGSTKMAVSPDPVRGLRATADGPTKIKLDWDAVPAAQ